MSLTISQHAAHRSARDRSQAPGQEERDRRTADLVARLAVCEDGQRREQLLDEIVVLNMPVARSVAARFRGRGLDEQDLEQVAFLALTRAARAFDPAQGHGFLAFAVPTIRGELKKHFRDNGWTVRPPRRVQELQGRIRPAREHLAQELGREPQDEELADRLVEPADAVRAAQRAEGCFTPSSLDQPVDEEASTPLGEVLPGDTREKDAAEARLVLAPAIGHLGERAREILRLRFFEDRTQREIADEIGVTQMHVSRLISGILTDLREDITGTDPEEAVAPGRTTRGNGS